MTTEIAIQDRIGDRRISFLLGISAAIGILGNTIKTAFDIAKYNYFNATMIDPIVRNGIKEVWVPASVFPHNILSELMDKVGVEPVMYISLAVASLVILTTTYILIRRNELHLSKPKILVPSLLLTAVSGLLVLGKI